MKNTIHFLHGVLVLVIASLVAFILIFTVGKLVENQEKAREDEMLLHKLKLEAENERILELHNKAEGTCRSCHPRINRVGLDLRFGVAPKEKSK